NLLWVTQKGCQIIPVSLPAIHGKMVFMLPFVSKAFQSFLSHFYIVSLVDRFNISNNRLTILIRHKFECVSDLMNDTDLMYTLRINSLNSFVQSFQIIRTQEQNVL